MDDALRWVVSPAGLAIAVAACLAARWAYPKLFRSDGTMSTTLPALALVVAAWAYGAQDVGLRFQSEENDRQRALHQGAIEAQALTIAELRGIVAFQAEHDGDWNLTLRKLDGRPFQAENLALIPRFLVDVDEGPVDRAGIPVQPTYAQSGVARIPNVLQSICRIEEALCAAGHEPTEVALDFYHEGKHHRVFAIGPE